MTKEDKTLKHYGVKGMKWGVIRSRRDRASNSSDDHKDSRVSKKKAVSTMSNAELRRLNERLQLERSNRDLQSRGALQKIKAGSAAVGTVLAAGATINAVITFANSPAGKAIASAVTGPKKDPNWLF